MNREHMEHYEMKLKTMARVAVATAGVAVAAGLSGTTTPAFADIYCGSNCSIHLTSGGLEYFAQVDNSYSGGGQTTWLWTAGQYYGPHVDYYLKNDSRQYKLYAPNDGQATVTHTQDIVKFRLCAPNGHSGDNCSDWRLPSYSH
jgi:hypothetical protein